jgi:hypothetical protein
MDRLLKIYATPLTDKRRTSVHAPARAGGGLRSGNAYGIGRVLFGSVTHDRIGTSRSHADHVHADHADRALAKSCAASGERLVRRPVRGGSEARVTKAAATLLARLPTWAGRRRLPTITPPEPHRSFTPQHTQFAQPAHLSSSSSDWIHLELRKSHASRMIARMQCDCVINATQAVRHRDPCPISIGERSVKAKAATVRILEHNLHQDFAVTNN